MGLFTRRQARPEAALAARDPLAAVPVAADGVEARADAKGRLQLRRALPPGRGIGGYLARKLRFERTVHINLDEHGSAYWRLADGRRTLAEIAALLAQELGRSDEESRRAVVLFTRSLMVRNLVNLKIQQHN